MTIKTKHATERVDVVDRNDRVVRTITRAQATEADILRVSGIFIFNAKKEILLQLRSERSFRYPSHWDCSGGGHVASGEEYATCAKRELFEETGIATEPEFLGKKLIKLDDGRTHMSAFFKGCFAGKIKKDTREVSALRFFSLKNIKDMIDAGEKFYPECLYALKKYFL